LRIVKAYWPVFAVGAILLGIVILLLNLCVKQNGGHFIYALDDAYIHMAMAQNVARHGVWGVTRYGFSSSTSSILWTLTLSLSYFIFGVHETLPLILNIICALLLLIASHFILSTYSVGPTYSFLLLLCLIFCSPLVSLIFVGMEHTAQILIDLLFVSQAARVLSQRKLDVGSRNLRWLLTLSPLVPLIRYEGLFLICVVCVLLMARGHILLACASGALALIPITVFGLISVSEGAFWLPNPVLLKGADPGQGPVVLLGHAFSQLHSASYFWLLLLLAAALYFAGRKRGRSFFESEQALLVIFILTTLLHITFSLARGQFYRYDAYLIAIGVLSCGVGLRDLLQAERLEWGKAGPLVRFAGFALVLSCSTGSLIARGIVSMSETTRATTNIYQQQFQMAMFLRDYYQGSVIVVNDIGAVNYFADIKCLDLFGLATMEVARAKREGTYNTNLISQLAAKRGAKIAIAYDSWLNRYGGAPLEWTRIEQWKIPNNIVAADDTVSFYAVDPSEIFTLRKNLAAFSTRLPQAVVQTAMGGRSSRP
jgi:hypothetical protein